jgi:hypothetical protein
VYTSCNTAGGPVVVVVVVTMLLLSALAFIVPSDDADSHCIRQAHQLLASRCARFN